MTTQAEFKVRRAALVVALRSGEYLQCKGRLKGTRFDQKMGYCCLGVACDLSQTGQWFLTGDGYIYGEDQTPDYSNMYVMTAAVKAYYGFHTDGGGFSKHVFAESLYDDLGEGSLPYLNDELKLTFSQISDIIEYEPEGMFIDAGD